MVPWSIKTDAIFELHRFLLTKGPYVLSTQQVWSKDPEKNQKTDNLKKMDFFMKLMNITDDDITDEFLGTKTEAEVTVENGNGVRRVPLFSLYNDITPPQGFAWSQYSSQTCNLQAEFVCLDWVDKM